MFSPWRKNYLQTLLAQGKTSQLNEDLIPTGFFYQSVYHLAHQYPSLANWLSTQKRVPFPFFMLVLALSLIGLGAWHRLLSSETAATPILMAMGVVGFSSLSLEFLVLVLFQVFLGYLYLEIGSLIACFMAGLAGGAYVLMGRESYWHSWRGITVGMQALLAVCSSLLFIFLRWNYFQMDLLSPGLTETYSLLFHEPNRLNCRSPIFPLLQGLTEHWGRIGKNCRKTLWGRSFGRRPGKSGDTLYFFTYLGY